MKELRTFILRGNVVDLAIGVVMGAAFGAVVTSLVQDVFTPLLGVFGTPDFTEAAVKVGKAELRYGLFLNALINLLIVSVALFFFVVRPLHRFMEKRHPTPPPSTRECPHCVSAIPVKATVCSQCTRDVEVA